MNEASVQEIEQIIGHKFSNKAILSQAFTHSSAVDNRLLSNERLEFLGDALLGVVICQRLFEQFSNYLEGNLTKIKSMLVSRSTCARIIKQMGLQKFLKLGKGMSAKKTLPNSLAAGLLEAIVAAIYLDGGFEPTRQFILRTFDSLIAQANAEQVQGNYKSLLQQYAQEHFNITPVYALLDEKGPDHNKCFELEVVIAQRHFPSAWGTNKKEAEQRAAFNALVELGVLDEAWQEDIN